MSARMKAVYVTALPNIAPAGTSITAKGEGTNLARAICAAVKIVCADKRLKGKRLVLPMRLIVTEGASNGD